MPELHALAPNFFCLDLWDLTLWFSYKTCIAFEIDGAAYKSENIWTKTTAKHLNQIFAEEVPNQEFENRLAEFMVNRTIYNRKMNYVARDGK